MEPAGIGDAIGTTISILGLISGSVYVKGVTLFLLLGV